MLWLTKYAIQFQLDSNNGNLSIYTSKWSESLSTDLTLLEVNSLSGG